MDMTPQLINIRDLQVGDEIIISGNSNLKYLKVLSFPRESEIDEWKLQLQPNNALQYSYTGRKRLKSFRCSIRQDEIKYKTSRGIEHTKKKYIFEPDISKHNKRISIVLNGRDVLLVKREEKNI